MVYVVFVRVFVELVDWCDWLVVYVVVGVSCVYCFVDVGFDCFLVDLW